MKFIKALTAFLLAQTFFAFHAVAQNQRISREEAEALIASLKPQQGTIHLHGDLATLQVPGQFEFLNGVDSNTVLVRLWGNPPQKEPLGMLLPANTSPINRDCWAVVVSYEENGYVKDKDAEKINYSDLLKQMKQSTVSENKERTKQGYSSIELIGWASPPRYDQDAHKLYWAKEYRFGDNEENTLNYNIRMLGRRGVLVLNSIAGITQLREIEKNTPAILSAVNFNPVNRYADFNPASDKVATYGIAALIAGGVAAKLGFFKGL